MGADDGTSDEQPRRRLAGTVAVILAGLGLTAGVPVGLVALVPNFDPGPPPDNRTSGSLALPNGPTPAGSPSTGPSTGPTTDPTTGPTVGPTTGGAGGTSSGTLRSSVSTPSKTPARTQLGPVPYEAEADTTTVGGSAWVYPYPNASGGHLVRNVGDWHSRRGPGWLRFNAVAVPVDGTYALTIHAAHLDGEPARTVVIATDSGGSHTIVVAAGSRCCATVTVPVRLRKGANRVTLSNSRGRAPAIDRIVVSGR